MVDQTLPPITRIHRDERSLVLVFMASIGQWMLLLLIGLTIGILLVKAWGATLPDAGQIAFAGDSEPDREIYLLDVGRGLRLNLTHNLLPDDNFAWSPDGSRIVFESGVSDNRGLYVMDATGANRRLLYSRRLNRARPVWSPNNVEVVIVLEDRVPPNPLNSNTPPFNRNLYIVNVDSGLIRPLTMHPAFDYLPTWSPDGSQVAFVSLRENTFDLYVVNRDGTNLRRLTYSPSFGSTGSSNPVWSPDGHWLAFLHVDVTNETDLYVMDMTHPSPTDADPIALTSHPRNEVNPVWSPDSRYIAFLSYRTGSWGLYRVDVTTQAVEHLIGGDDGVFYGMLAWSPDGGAITFVSDRDGPRDIYILDIATRTLRRLTHDPTYDLDPTWRP